MVLMIVRILKVIYKLISGRKVAGASNKSLAGIAASLLGEGGGQLPGLLKNLTSSGMGDMVQSWVGTGKNIPLSASQVKSALGSDALSSIASQLGVSEKSAASKVASALPQLVDKLTPDGKVPDKATLAQNLAQLLGK